MHRLTAVRLAAVVPVALLLVPLVASRPAPTELGAPWVSLEVPANPLDDATRDAAFVVRVYHHENPASLPVTGTAEGLVNGKRRSVALQFAPTGKAGVYAVRQQWPAEGHWIASVSVGNGSPNLIVELGPNGGVTEGRYYGTTARSLSMQSVRVVSQLPDARATDAALQALAARQVARMPE